MSQHPVTIFSRLGNKTHLCHISFVTNVYLSKGDLLGSYAHPSFERMASVTEEQP